ncbi:MAG: serine/threonine-protein kinase [Marmoricola sp.]
MSGPGSPSTTVAHPAVLDDRYVLNGRLGSGGMADVYRATDRVLHRQVAVKILRDTAEGKNRTRFADEARTLASLNHPGLITLLDAGFQGDHPYLVMELAEGATLSEAIASGSLEPVEVARIGAELATALDYAHGAGVVHRDVKPSNVLLCDDGRVLLADFGIARLIGSTDHHTRTGEAIGSPAYLAPEQVAGDLLTPAVDVFSLGLVLLEALTGVRAYAGTPIEAAVARLTASPEIPPSVSADWRDLIEAATHRDPDMRPTAAEIATRLVPIVGSAVDPGPHAGPEHTQVLDLSQGLPDVAPFAPLPPVVAPRRTVDRRMVLVGVAVAVVAGLLVLLVAVLAGSGGSGSSPTTPVPSGVPSNLQGPLGNLHHAIQDAQ